LLCLSHNQAFLFVYSNYWRGLLDEPGSESLTSSTSSAGGVGSSSNGSAGSNDVTLRTPLIGISLSEEAASAVAEHLDSRNVRVPRLDYAFLSLGNVRDSVPTVSNPMGNLLGAGGTARVYSGTSFLFPFPFPFSHFQSLMGCVRRHI
jgi:hypothetical protein